MFYSNDLLNLKGNSRLGLVWVAATLGSKSTVAKKLNRREFCNVNIVETCDYLINPPQPLSLRLASNMMIGVTRVYGQQYSFFYGDVQQFCSRLNRVQFSDNIDLSESDFK
jgi:meiotic recombination protein REC8